MKIKGLLLGSAAALAMGASAQAADLPVAAVSACPAGTLDLDGSCLDIGGYVAMDLTFDSVDTADARDVQWTTDVGFDLTATTETDMGTLIGYIEVDLVGDLTEGPNHPINSVANISGATLQLGGFIAGYETTLAVSNVSADALDGMGGDSDYATNFIGYTGSAGAFSYAVAIEESEDLIINGVANVSDIPTLAGSFGYDFGLGSVGLGMVAFSGKDLDANASATGYSLAASVSVDATDTVSLVARASINEADTTGFLVGNLGADAATGGDWNIQGSVSVAATDTVTLIAGASLDDDEDYEIGANVVWAPVSGFTVLGEAIYKSNTSTADDAVTDFLIGITRSF